ncbi:MAG: hypothetical protein LBI56_04155 [Puniceicoccales bacterium]|jgi:hypothetical protein|nr:hypothetical protein [Puniceicoccales bacterium]
MKKVVVLGLILAVGFAVNYAYAFQRVETGNFFGEGKIIRPPKAVASGNSSSKIFKNLSKKFEFLNSKEFGLRNLGKQSRNGHQLSMQKLNKFQYRRSHSIKSDVPQIHLGGEK